MKFVITALVLLTFCCANVNGQQESGFKIADPGTQTQQRVSGNPYYTSQSRQTEAYNHAPPNVERNFQQNSGAPNSAAPRATAPNFVASNSLPPESDARTEPVARVSMVATNVEPVQPAISPLPRMPVAIEQYCPVTIETTTLRTHHLFGDPDASCDEWENFFNCGGLKANPGHLGRFWLRGGDQCEVNSRVDGRGRCRCNSCRKKSLRGDCKSCND